MKLPQFTLRELCWLVLAIGLSLGWWVDHRKNQSWRHTALNFQWLVEQEGWTVRWKPRGLFPEIDAVTPPPDEKRAVYGFNYGAKVSDIIAVLKSKPPE